ncbi:MAG TPA: DUF58 domain-containing protein [Thermoplasmata archaeon]|nr:DUF58 domain-containing protein [Thermoplasmata archaeon]
MESPAHVALRPRALLYFLAAAGLAAAGIATRSAAPLVAAVPFALAPAAAALLAPRAPPKAHLAWTEAGEGTEVRVRGHLEVEPPAEAVDLTVGFLPAPPLELSDPPQAIPVEHRVDLHVTYRAPYPCLAWVSRPTVVWRDPLGLIELPAEVDGPALHIERFPPEVSRLGAVALRRTTQQPGETRSRALGVAGEFFGVRVARSDDPARRINWRATARSGRLMANEFVLERTGDLLIVLDVRPTSMGPRYDTPLLAVGRAAASGIASAFLHEKSRVGVAVFGEFASIVPLGSGRIHRLRVARAVERAELSETSGPPERLAVTLRRFFPPGVTTLLITPLGDDDTGFVLPHLRRRGFPTVVLSPSPLPLLGPGDAGPESPEGTAYRLLALVRRARLADVWTEAPVVEWSDYWSLAPLVNYFSNAGRTRGSQ